MSNRPLFKIVGLVGIVTIVSKIFGLVRDLVIAKVYGTSIAADAYNFAYLLTGNALVLLGGLGGPFHSATITTLTKIKDNGKQAGSFLIKILTSTFIVLLLITFVVLYFREDIIPFIVPGKELSHSYRLELWQLTIMQLEIMSPLIIISGLLGILCGVSNVYKDFFWPSFGPVLPSAAIIIAVLYFNDPNIGIALGIGTLIGAVFQLLVQLPALLRAGLYDKLKFSFIKNQQAVGDFNHFIGPAILSTTIGQLTVYIDGYFCSGLPEGSWTATVFANRLIQLPLGILVTSFLVPFFPRFSELVSEKNIAGLKQTSILVVRSLWFLIVPVAIYLFLFAKPVVEFIFERGAFDESSTILVSNILIALLLSMIAYVARDTLTRVFYSLGNSRIPLLIALFSICVKIILNSILAPRFQAPGIAFATSIATLLNFLLLWFLLRKEIGSLGWFKHLRGLFKIAICAFVMFLCGFIVVNVFPLPFSDYNFFSKFVLIFISFFFCFAVYFGLALTLRIEEASKIFKEVKAKLSAN